MTASYTFGDGDVAVRRIGLVAEVFAASSRALLDRATAGLDRRDVTLDLGCGPGHTTRLLAEVGAARRTLGLDASDSYLDAARAATRDPTVAYAVHDVTRLPLPEAPADVVYARLLLAHLPQPLDLARGWLTQVRPGGVLVLEEVEHIEAPPGVLRAYEHLVTALVAAEGGTMAAGPRLAPLGGACMEVRVDRSAAARMFGLNLAVWGDDAVRRGLASAAEVADLAAGLDAVGSGPPAAWTLRQVVCRAE